MPAQPAIQLRAVEPRDLPTLFEFQLDPESNTLAGTKPRSAEKYYAVWDGIFKDARIVPRVIELDGRVVGSISCFTHEDADAVGYWIAREHWGKGIASRALALFLAEMPRRPLHATAARDNAVSIRILEKAGFRLLGYHMGEETERFVAREVASFVLD